MVLKDRIGARIVKRGTTVMTAVMLLGSMGIARAQATDPPKPATPPATGQPTQTPLVLGTEAIDPNQPIKSGFIVNVSVVGEPEPSGNYQVDPGGNIALRYNGITSPVSVKDLLPKQATAAIVKFLKTFINNPQVTVSIVDVPRPLVSVYGAVLNQGTLAIPQEATLADVLARTVLLETADLTNVHIVRRVAGQDQPINITVHYDRFIRPAADQPIDLTQNPVLQNKDQVVVFTRPGVGSPANSDNTITVLGEVKTPQQALVLKGTQPTTVRDAINLAGGVLPGANPKQIVIRRIGLQQPLVIDFDKAQQGDPVNNVELKVGDSIYVQPLERNSFVNVSGAFAKPGKLSYDKPITLTEAIQEAGGPIQNAKEKDGTIFRHPDDNPLHTRVIHFNFVDIAKGKAPDIALMANDSVFIRQGNPSNPLNLLTALQSLTSVAYLYSSFSGRSSVSRP